MEIALGAIPIPWAGLSIIAAKIVRGCEYQLKRRFVEAPYGIRTFVDDSDVVPESYASFAKLIDFGPGCNVRRVFITEDPNMVFYRISIWGTLYLNANINLEDGLRKLDQMSSKAEGVPEENSKAVRISPYLRRLP